MITGILYALAATALSGNSAVLSKVAVRRADLYYVCAISNTVILLIFLAATLLEGKEATLPDLQNLLLLAGSGFALAFSWLFYYLAVREGQVAVILAVQNLAVVLTLGLCRIVLGESVSWMKGVGSVCIIVAAGIMAVSSLREGAGNDTVDVELKVTVSNTVEDARIPVLHSYRWLWYDMLSMMFLSLSLVLTRLTQSQASNNMIGMWQYLIVAAAMWVLAFRMRSPKVIADFTLPAWGWTVLCGITLGLSYAALYRSFEYAPVNSATAIFRMSIVFSALIAEVLLREPVTRGDRLGLPVMVAGILLYTL